jgi:tetratricopeptide (TPR) repeat protein
MLMRSVARLSAALLLVLVPVWAAGQSARGPSVPADNAASYEASWRAAGALIDIGKQTPDRVRSPARDSAYAEAETYARKAVALNPEGVAGHFMLAQAIGRASLSKGTRERIRSAEEIRREALRAIALDPTHAGAFHVLGRWHAQIMRLSAFQRFFAQRLLGGSSFGEASWEQAIANLERAVALAPTTIQHRLELAQVFVDCQRYGEARPQLDAVASLPVADAMDASYKERAAGLRQTIDAKASR